MQSRQCNV